MGLTTFLVVSSFGWGEGGEHEMRKLGHVSINLHKISFGWGGKGAEHEMRKLGHVSINLHQIIILQCMQCEYNSTMT